MPTTMPTSSPTAVCEPYANSVASLNYMGNGTDCRGGLNSSWPGGLSCASPYVVCLPLENTPVMIRNMTYRYNLDECKQECANDQRCLGMEFIPDDGSNVGDCNLIDDIPVVVTNPGDGNVSCYKKSDYCNPSFEAVDLTQVMLDCYCPNNRKGSYTKKVKRTVNNTRFCGNDTQVDDMIRKAQANRMFHLCENWCLFQTEDPSSESWYYDPWNSCWREQYVEGDTHMTYCSRVIRNPNTIEMQFVNDRKLKFCRNHTNIN